MKDLAKTQCRFPAMSEADIAKVQRLYEASVSLEQAPHELSHLIHAGMYARTMILRAGNFLVGALVQVKTIVIFFGDAMVFTGNSTVRLQGYHVIAAEAMRQQVFIANTDCHITAIFATDAQTVKDAEDEATSEPHLLLSRREGSTATLKGE
jgi:hypothetical protein